MCLGYRGKLTTYLSFGPVCILIHATDSLVGMIIRMDRQTPRGI